MSDEMKIGLPETVKLPWEAENHYITPYFRHESILNVAQSELQGKPVYDLREVVQLRFAGDRNYSPVFPVEAMHRKIGDRVITFAERWSEQYGDFIVGDEQRAKGTALEMLSDYGITPAQLSICRALKIYSIEALDALGPHEVKNLGMSANALKAMARRFMEDRERKNLNVGEDVASLKAEIEKLKAQATLPNEEATPEEIEEAIAEADDEFTAMNDEELKAYITDKAGSRPKGNPKHETLVRMAREAA